MTLGAYWPVARHSAASGRTDPSVRLIVAHGDPMRPSAASAGPFWSRLLLTACTLALGACAASSPTGTSSVATKLAFTVQPGTAAAGAAIAPAVQVAIQDASGNTVTRTTTSVTVALGTNPSGASLSGTVMVAAVNGVATFSTLSVNDVGTGYTLTASASGLSGATSASFNVTPCAATTPATLLACGAAVQAGRADVIEVQGSLVCSGAAACKLRIENAPHPFVIRGAAGSLIRREDHYDYELLAAVGPADVTFQDLVIDERADAACQAIFPVDPPVENPDCKPSIFVFGADHAVIKNATVAHAKSQAVLIAMTHNVHVSHARFVDAHEFGLQVSNVDGSLLVEDALFWHIYSTAIVLYDAHGTAASPLVVRRSLFEHNHLTSIFYQCGPPGGPPAPCGGGQFLLSGLVDFLRVEGTAIRDGSNEGFPSIAIGGMELNPPGIRDITVVNSDVHNHGMWAIYMNPNPVDCARVTVMNNELYLNGQAPNYNGVNVGNFDPGIATETGTCQTPACRTVALGALWAIPADGVSWTSNDLASPQVSVDGAVVSTERTGVIHPAPGATVVLLDGTTEMDRLTAP